MNDDLVRIEYKLDLIIQALCSAGIMVPDLPSLVGIQEDCCPICAHPIRIVPDFTAEVARYGCGCTIPNKVVPGISGLLNLNEDSTDGRSRTPQGSTVFQQGKDRGSDS